MDSIISTGLWRAPLGGLLATGVMLLFAGAADAQEFPTKPIRIVTSAAGGGGDLSTRVIAQGVSGPLGQQVVVDNRAVIGAEFVAKSPPDGYTLILYGSNIWTAPLLQSTPWDPVRDFSPIMIATNAPNEIVVHPSLPVKNVRELIALAKVLQRAEVKERLFKSGIEPVGSSPEQLAAFVKADMARLGKVIKDNNIRE